MSEMTVGQQRGRGRGRTPKVNPYGSVPADPLEREQLAREYGYALNVIYSVPEIRRLFEQAFSDRTGQWTVEKFQAALQNTEWFRGNSQYARVAWTQEQVGGKDWEDRVGLAKEIVQRRATQLGARLTSAEVDAMARRYLYEGWGEAGRAALMDTALSGEISYLPDERGAAGFRGQAGSFVDELRMLAQANGLQYSDSWYESQARSVAAGLTTEEDAAREIREQAASRWGAWGDKIRGGMTAYDLASPYINLMSETLEISPDSINLNDPYIQRAMMGNEAMPLWEFQRQLRNDPRWMNTNYAQNEITGVADAVMEMFGLRG